MRDKKITSIALIATVLLLAGCTGEVETGTGVVIKNELSSEQMQPGGSVMLRTSVNNFFDNELQNAKVKLVRSFGTLSVTPEEAQSLGIIQANPNATARSQWTMTVDSSARSGASFTNRVRVCFTYNQTSWHDIVLVDNFDVETVINKGNETGPLKITITGLEDSYIHNQNIKTQIPISIGIQNDYNGYVGTMDLSRGEVANLTYVGVKIYDTQGGPTPDCRVMEINNGSPFGECVKSTTNFEIMSAFTNPSCGDKTSGCFKCDNSLWDSRGYFNCYAQNLSVFGDLTFLGTKLNVTGLQTEELIELVEVTLSYDYCIESEDFTLTVFQPGAR